MSDQPTRFRLVALRLQAAIERKRSELAALPPVGQRTAVQRRQAQDAIDFIALARGVLLMSGWVTDTDFDDTNITE